MPSGPQTLHSLPHACPWLVATQDLEASLPMVLEKHQWDRVASVRRPTDARDNLLLYRKR